MKVRYFAWVRERVGHAEEEIDLPAGVTSVADLIAVPVAARRGLRRRLRRADRHPRRARPEHVEHDTRIVGAREVAFFPPMTGG